MHRIAAKITILTEKEMSVKLSLSLKLWLSQYDWQSFGERENFSKSLIGILFLLSNLENITSFSLSLLKSGESFSKFLFLFSKLGKGILDFSFSTQNWRNQFQIYLSLLDWTFWGLQSVTGGFTFCTDKFCKNLLTPSLRYNHMKQTIS